VLICKPWHPGSWGQQSPQFIRFHPTADFTPPQISPWGCYTVLGALTVWCQNTKKKKTLQSTDAGYILRLIRVFVCLARADQASAWIHQSYPQQCKNPPWNLKGSHHDHEKKGRSTSHIPSRWPMGFLRSLTSYILKAWPEACVLIIMTSNHINHIACKTKSSKESMRQNSQQHDTGIDPLVLQMLLPFHCLHLSSPTGARRRCCHHVVYICSCPTGARRCCHGNIFCCGSCAIGEHRCCCKYEFALAALPLLLVQSDTQIITHVHCPPAPRPPKHIPC